MTWLNRWRSIRELRAELKEALSTAVDEATRADDLHATAIKYRDGYIRLRSVLMQRTNECAHLRLQLAEAHNRLRISEALVEMLEVPTGGEQ